MNFTIAKLKITSNLKAMARETGFPLLLHMSATLILYPSVSLPQSLFTGTRENRRANSLTEHLNIIYVLFVPCRGISKILTEVCPLRSLDFKRYLKYKLLNQNLIPLLND